MLDVEAIVWGYRYILDREPENALVIENARSIPSVTAFRRILLDSTEFRSKFELQHRPPKWIMAEVFAGKRVIWADINDRSVSYPCIMNEYEPIETAVFSRLLQDGDTFVDIGANIGWFSLLASTLIGESGTIHAFEPRPETFSRLNASLALNGLNGITKAHDFGLSDTAGTMNLTWGENTPNPGGSRLVHGDLPDGQAGTRVVLRTLDSLSLNACHFIKLDIEGAEMLAIRGARQTISTYRPIIMSEVHNSQLLDVSRCSSLDYVRYVCELGYVCIEIDAPRSAVVLPIDDGASIGELVNVIFAPTEIAESIRSKIVA